MESLCTAPSRAGKDASGGKTMVVVVAFFSLTDGSQQFQNDSFKMFFFFFFFFFKCWEKFDPQRLKDMPDLLLGY